MESLLMKIHPKDNVAIALRDISAGSETVLLGKIVKMKQNIPQAHKVALVDMQEGDLVYKYGCTIAHTLTPVSVGDHLSQHNISTNLLNTEEYQYHPKFNHVATALEDREVCIYRRSLGDIGIRNELWIIPTVGCVNAIIKTMKNRLEREIDLTRTDGVHIFTHQYGCSQLGSDHHNTRTLLQNLVKHPNAGGVLVVGLGCENNQMSVFRDTLGEFDQDRVRFMVCQNYDDEVEYGVSLLTELVSNMSGDRRVGGKLSELSFGLECGGSDGFSGITANPLLGIFSDYVIAYGGTSVLTEVPEMFGAEHILMSRCRDEATFQKLVVMINEFKRYFIDNNQPIYENPSPGNKLGGISTLEEKSLGCTQKSGQSEVVDVLSYGEKLRRRGLSLLSAPGNDAISTSALSMAGCHMVLFSTGRGTPYGGPVPTLKIATNKGLSERKPHWIDFDASPLIRGTSIEVLLTSFIDTVVEHVNGKLTCNERNDFREIAIFKNGVTL